MHACDDPEFMFVLNNSNSSDVWPAINIKKSKTWAWENGFFYKSPTYTFIRTWTLALSIQVKKECWAWPPTCSLVMTKMGGSLSLASSHPTPCSVRHSISREQGEEWQSQCPPLASLQWNTHTYLHLFLYLLSLSVSLCLCTFFCLPLFVCACVYLPLPFCAFLCLSVPVCACLCLSLPVSVCLSPQAPPCKNTKVYF